MHYDLKTSTFTKEELDEILETLDDIVFDLGYFGIQHPNALYNCQRIRKIIESKSSKTDS